MPLKRVINTTAQGIVAANRGLHPTNFPKPLLYKTKNLLTLFIKYYFFLHILFLWILLFLVGLLDVIVFTPVVCRADQKQCCHFNSQAIHKVYWISVGNTAPSFQLYYCSITDIFEKTRLLDITNHPLHLPPWMCGLNCQCLNNRSEKERELFELVAQV